MLKVQKADANALTDCLKVVNQNWHTEYAIEDGILYEGLNHICMISEIRSFYVSDYMVLFDMINKHPVVLTAEGGRVAGE